MQKLDTEKSTVVSLNTSMEGGGAKKGSTPSGQGVVTVETSSQLPSKDGALSLPPTAKVDDRDPSVISEAPPLVKEVPHEVREAQYLLSSCVGGGSAYAQDIAEAFVNGLMPQDLLRFAQLLKVESGSIAAIKAATGLKLGGVVTKVNKLPIQVDPVALAKAKSIVVERLILKLNSSSQEVFAEIANINVDERQFYGAFLHLLKVGDKYEGLREYLDIPRTQCWGPMPKDIIGVHTPLTIRCTIGKNREKYRLMENHVAAIGNSEALMGSPPPTLARQISAPQEHAKKHHSTTSHITIEKAIEDTSKVLGSEVLYRYKGAESSVKFDDAISKHIDGSPETRELCGHWVSPETVDELLRLVTQHLAGKMDLTRDANFEDYTNIRIIVLEGGRITIQCDRHFSQFCIPSAHKKRKVKHLKGEGHLHCVIHVKWHEHEWQVCDCTIDYRDDVNSSPRREVQPSPLEGPKKKTERHERASSLSRSLSESDLPSSGVETAQAAPEPARAKRLEGDRWLVCSDFEKAQDFELMKNNLNFHFDVWEEQIESAEQQVKSKQMTQELTQKVGGIFKKAEVDEHYDLEKVVRQCPSDENKQPKYTRDQIVRAMEFNLALARTRRAALTERCDEVCKAVLELSSDIPQVDESLFEKDDLPSLRKLLGMYDKVRDWHKETLEKLIDLTEADLTQKSTEDIETLKIWAVYLETQSKEILEPYRTPESEGGVIRTELKIGGASGTGPDDVMRRKREEATALPSKVAFTYSNIFKWYQRKTIYLLDKELERRGVESEATQQSQAAVVHP
ncbi:hypothetical protein [Parendozoicomonas sp. Alg238-R29]|uniref:hypothetical protein n=1 Tax=Parendozoicomonas sp. Alg238-R29 TaxID=2993446 RepID=UPI00248E38E0|nr:hypothetical protein [Parendozoicomonas sp. Alg238-R29]